MNWSNYVLEINEGGRCVLYNSISKMQFDSTTPEKILRENFFLAGQEQDQLEDYLFGQIKRLKITVLPTQLCNLRCKHCAVNQFLVKNEPNFPVDAFIDFMRRYMDKYNPPSTRLSFTGGEPLLRSDILLDIMDKLSFIPNMETTVATNLTMTLTDEIFEVMSRLDHVGVSIDGDEETHNAQRLSSGNPYVAVINNLKQLMLKGFRDKVNVRAAMRDNDHREEYLRTMLRLGVREDRVIYGLVCPCQHSPEPSVVYMDYLNNRCGGFKLPCCKYQYMSNFVIDPYGQITSDFYIRDLIGKLDDDLGVLEENFRNSILSEMPVLHDDNCLNCPVIGHCWGDCCQHNYYVKKPSDFCQQQALIKAIKDKFKE